MKKKHVAVALAAVAIIVFAKLLFFSSGDSAIPTYTIKRGDFHILVIESGSIRAKQSSTITAPRIMSGGNLQVTFLAPEGSIATQDQVLARFDPSNAMKRIQDKQTELKTAMADMDKLKAQQKGDEQQAKTDYENAKLSFQLAEIAKERMQFEPEAKKREAALEFERAGLSFEQARLNLENKSIVRKSELGNLQLRISQIQSDIGQSMKEMDQLTIKASISGLIVYENNWSTGRKIAVGDQPWPGMPIISLPDLSAAQVEVSVNEMDIARLKLQQKVEIIPDAFPDKKFLGTVNSISQIGREKASGSNIKVFDIVIDIDKTDPILKPGITTTNKIIVGTRPKVLSIPIACVVEEEKKTYAFVKNGRSFDKRRVELGERNDNFVVVKNGVREGEQVALRNPEEKEEPKEEKSLSTPSGKK
jgi:HlyD family secretion protein